MAIHVVQLMMLEKRAMLIIIIVQCLARERTNKCGESTPLPVSHILLDVLKQLDCLLLLLLVSGYDHWPLDGVLAERERGGGGENLKPSG